MSETIYKNYMTRNYQNYINQFQEKQTAKAKPGAGETVSQSFLDVVNKYAGKAVVSEAYPAQQISTQDMTMEAYKEYIADKISRIPMHPTQIQNSVAIHISEAGFEAMKQDPEYEKWVLDGLKADFASNDPWFGICGGHYVVHNFGATKEEYRGQSWYPEYQNGKGESLFNQKAEGSFWERRVKRHQEYQKRHQEYQRQQQEYQKWQFSTLPFQSQMFLREMTTADINI